MAQPHSAGAPEGTRAAHAIRHVKHAGPIVAIALLCALFAVAAGDEAVRLTVANATPHLLDVVVAGKTFPRVAPGGHAVYESSGAATVAVKVAYASGQGITGSAERSFAIAPAHPATYGSYVYWGCQMGGTLTSPASGGPTTWSVTPDTLAGR